MSKEIEKNEKASSVNEGDYVRINNVLIHKKLNLLSGLGENIKGFSGRTIQYMCRKLKLSLFSRLKDISSDQIKQIEEFIKNPDFPSFMNNTRKDYKTGKDFHLFGEDINALKNENITRAKSIRSYVGNRYIEFQSSPKRFIKVRGQNTKSNGRKRSNIGIKKRGA